MPTYSIAWTIELAAKDPRQAAEKAFRIMQKRDTEAKFFMVNLKGHPDTREYIDLLLDEVKP